MKYKIFLSERMRMYLTEYLAWALAGVPESPRFDTWMGLCTNTRFWARAQHISNDGCKALQDELSNLLVASHLDVEFPFGGKSRYLHESAYHTHHKNELRLAWVRKQLEVK